MSINLEQMMTLDEMQASGINKLSESEQQELLRWGLRMYGLGQHKVGDIHDIKYDGRVGNTPLLSHKYHKRNLN